MQSCSKVLDFLERLDDRIRCMKREVTIAMAASYAKPGNGDSSVVRAPDSWSKGREFESPQKKEKATPFLVLLHGQVSVKNDSKVPGRIREADVVRAKSNRVREGTVGLKEDENGKRRASVLSSLSLS